MVIRWLSILLALIGLGVAVYTVGTNSGGKGVSPPPASPPSVNPFPHGIAAGGSVEAATRNIAVAAPEGGLITEVFVDVGQQVKKGQPLFQLDGRLLEADLVRANAARAVAEAELAQLKSEPRAEVLPALRAALERAKVRLADEQDQLTEMEGAKERNAVSRTELSRRRFAVQAATADVAQAQATLTLAESGAWTRQIQVSQSKLQQADAEIASIQLRLDRFVVRAPIDATVLKRNVEAGQYTSVLSMGGGNAQAAMVVGDLSHLNVRARVDEEDAPLLRQGAKGVARVRGVAPEDLTLRMIRIEPLAQAKQDLMGTTTERVDTRVIEVIFEVLVTPKAGVYPGQAVDVFIETESAGEVKGKQ